jgi:hypothetical protein
MFICIHSTGFLLTLLSIPYTWSTWHPFPMCLRLLQTVYINSSYEHCFFWYSVSIPMIPSSPPDLLYLLYLYPVLHITLCIHCTWILTLCIHSICIKCSLYPLLLDPMFSRLSVPIISVSNAPTDSLYPFFLYLMFPLTVYIHSICIQYCTWLSVSIPPVSGAPLFGPPCLSGWFSRPFPRRIGWVSPYRGWKCRLSSEIPFFFPFPHSPL